MRYFFLYGLLAYLFGNPLFVLAVLALAYLLIDRRYIGLLPDFTRPFRRRRRLAQLAEEVRLNPANATGQLELGALYLERGDTRRALHFLEKARERMADSARLSLLLGKCYYRLGRTAEAWEVLEKAVALNPKVGHGEPYYYLLLLACRATPRDESALAENRARILSYGSPEVFYRAGRVLRKSGDRNGAGTMFREAVENYQVSPKGFRRTHRRWALASRLQLFFLDR